MPRYAGYNRPRAFGTGLVQAPAPRRDNYRVEQTAQRRHDYLAGAPNVGTPLTLSGENYLGVTLARFRRSFGAGTDDPPTATAGNNYQTPDVFNGSLIQDLKAQIRMTNKSNADPVTLTVYKIAWSFYDGIVADTLWGTPACALDWTTAATDEGEIDWRAVTALTLSQNSMNNSKFRQHYFQPMGEITLGLEGSGRETVELNFNGIPPKCKRSQTGMFYGYVFYNDADKNEGRTIALDYSLQNHFVEIPSANRLPWLA